MSTAEANESRPITLQDRLGFLFGASPRSSLDQSRPSTPRSQASQSEVPHSAPANNDTNMHRSASVVSNSIKPPRTPPVVRWLASSSETSNHRRSASDLGVVSTNSPSKDQMADKKKGKERIADTTDDIADEGQSAVALRQAIEDEVFKIQRPPEARMAPQSHDQDLRPFRHPVLLDNLARASMPTASLTRPLPSSFSLQPSLVTQSPATYSSSSRQFTTQPRNSIDSLRSLTARDRGIQTSATSMAPAASTATRWWFQDGNKEAVDNILREEDKAPTAEQEAEHIKKKYLTPKCPVVFCHGLLGFDSVSLGASFAPLQITHWRGIKEVLEENGVEVLITKVPATSGVDARARVLAEKIAEVYPGREVHLIGHSMGGLDCRYLVSKLRPKEFKVRSVTTIATPHHGSYFADYFLETIGKSRIPALTSFLDYLPNGGGDGKAFEGLTLEAMKKFNEEVPNVEGVEYFSWGASFQPSLVDAFKWPHSVILDKEGPNDGLVSVSSAQWGKYLGTLQDVNHLDLVGWINTARYKWAELTGKEIKFKPASFYLEVTARLAEEVEKLTWDDSSDREVLFSAHTDDEDSFNFTKSPISAKSLDAPKLSVDPESDKFKHVNSKASADSMHSKQTHHPHHEKKSSTQKETNGVSGDSGPSGTITGGVD